MLLTDVGGSVSRSTSRFRAPGATKRFCGSAADRVHRSRPWNELLRVDLVPNPLRLDTGADGCGDLFIPRTVPKQAADIGLFDCEQAVAYFTVGGDSKPVAVQTE